MAVGDFNGDGKLDLAVANNDSNTVSILLGDGTGNFTLASSPATGYMPVFRGGGRFQWGRQAGLGGRQRAASTSTVSILLGDGTGNFTLASSPATGSWPDSVAVGDFNGDGKLDLAVANYGSNTVSILLGDGTGNFTLASSPAAGSYPTSVAVGDFNGDGKLDLAVANLRVGDTVSILLGDGTGNFTLASSPATGRYPDFRGSGRLQRGRQAGPGGRRQRSKHTVSILLGDGTGNFTLASSPSTGSVIPHAHGVGRLQR